MLLIELVMFCKLKTIQVHSQPVCSRGQRKILPDFEAIQGVTCTEKGSTFFGVSSVCRVIAQGIKNSTNQEKGEVFHYISLSRITHLG